MTDPPYLRIAAEIRRRIVTGELREGQKIPSTRQIIAEWGVAMATATKVLATLKRDGLVIAKPGTGTVVASRAPKAAPRTEAELSRERVVRAAIRIADAEGIRALSMRRVASGLGVATMALYRHVSAKDDLILEMADVALGEVRFPPDPPSGWRAQLELMARAQWALFRRHPWLAQALSVTRPQPLPNLLHHADWATRALDGHGLPSSTIMYAHITIFNHVRGTALNFEAEAESESGTARTADDWLAEHEPILWDLVSGGRFPNFTSVVMRAPFDFDLDTLFEFGLQRLLDGFAVLLARAG
ncbi:TetR/AcrR family transcriptional regulator C-terminal domain-containing protein [Amycolatopsis regifaucium]|uniref:GntR family transcriptional regulator n=1 Tax=Amycolatopsis regifaucium TaxID=546365 RepID=A0A154MN72_9PSEU|nr:TetR/AcrR family transcriptional regulator C-terminal domain-containing protein [Amycolatopsis regifaucium]KZB85277.1 GntR family transcriptional regulator [Amycolatopsis regifaucium]OKA04246.1 GntR family transcriptional regulator [Amycolatopsis regifaucium]SFH92828.1 DNA-binding transcriptional regulator YhcF, GntR family [Amycolatopsis regifaucium]